MQFDIDVLPRMAEFEYFQKTFENYARDAARRACLNPQLSLSRLHDAYFGWRDDLKRITERETNLSSGPDHFKQCGHLAYWLRRRAPVIEYVDLIKIYENDNFIYPDEQALRDILDPYGGEYLAFDFGFQVCQFYENNRVDQNKSRTTIPVTREYIIDMCHLLKFKNVSPHSIYMLYRSLFL